MTTTSTATTTLGDLLDRLLDAGAVVSGQVQLGLADIDLVLLDLRALLIGVESARRRAGVADEEIAGRTRHSAAPVVADLPPLPARIEMDDERPEQGLIGLVLLLVDVLRQVMEGQALARMEGGSLSAEEIDRLGRALQLLDHRVEALRNWLTNDVHHGGTKGELDSWR